MSLLSMANDVCAVVGFPALGSVATNTTDQLARQMFGLANLELGLLSKAKTWRNLTVEYSFATVAGQEVYPLPEDYDKLVSNTAYRAGEFASVRASVTPQEWGRRKHYLLSNLDRTALRIMGYPATIHVDPVPAEVDTLLFEYVSKAYAVQADGTRVERYMNDSDTSVVDEGLVALGLMWRIKKAKGLDFTSELSEYNEQVAIRYARETASPDIPVGSSMEAGPITDGYVPTYGYGA